MKGDTHGGFGWCLVSRRLECGVVPLALVDPVSRRPQPPHQARQPGGIEGLGRLARIPDLDPMVEIARFSRHPDPQVLKRKFGQHGKGILRLAQAVPEPYNHLLVALRLDFRGPEGSIQFLPLLQDGGGIPGGPGQGPEATDNEKESDDSREGWEYQGQGNRDYRILRL